MIETRRTHTADSAVALLAVLAMVVCGCGGRRVVRGPDGTVTASAAPADSLEAYIAKVRHLSSEARAVSAAPSMVESRDPVLAASMALAIARPSSASYRGVAEVYRRMGIVDKAFQFLGKARALNSRDGATYDALARLWRDSGFPELALGDASRAAYYAPRSAAAHNTLGTVFQALGRHALARGAYRRALEIDPQAPYALNNLCYALVIERDARRATAACETALRLQPGLEAARQNLALARALGGNPAGPQTDPAAPPRGAVRTATGSGPTAGRNVAQRTRETHDAAR